AVSWYESKIIQIERLLGAAESERDSAVQAASTDPLTGLFNRRGISLLTHKVLGAQMRFSHDDFSEEADQKVWIAVAVIDLDGFKSVNDTFGHAMGDTIILLAAALLNRYFKRGTDIVSRLGGDEFLVFFVNNDDTSSIIARLEAFREHFATEASSILSGKISVTASCGVKASLISGGQIDPDALIKQADTLMYQAKNGGKNRVVARL
ncbi:MAG: GGDEF domain-containing protein, partial [Candidatus Moranbacteria bacterium]|nr:GGDEF domain-containing protein [Candidatus Moranbacteria bacterium]